MNGSSVATPPRTGHRYGTGLTLTVGTRQRWPPPMQGNGQVSGVELRGLEPLTPTLPVRPDGSTLVRLGAFPQVSALSILPWTALDGSGCVAVATKMAHAREAPTRTPALSIRLP
jgi:hypothetical protein